MNTRWNPSFLQDLLASGRSAMGAVIRAAAEEARANVPVDTGELRDSIAATEKGDEARITFAGHGVVLEAGTANRPATPWITPAIESTASIRKWAEEARRLM